MAKETTTEIFSEEQVKRTQKIANETRRVKDEVGKLNQLSKTFGEHLGDIAKTFTAIDLADFSSNLLKTAKSMTELNTELHRSVINAGKGVEGLKTYKDVSISLSKELGATFDQASKISKLLAEKQYAGTAEDIKKAADASFMLSKAFNISEEEVTANTIELQKWGQISADTATAMYADMMKVAQSNGLTKDGVQAVMSTTKEYSGVLKAFGKTPQDIQKMNMSLTKSVSALEKVGITAKDATGMIQGMLDPENIEANIPKFAAMGVSITDAITGNLDADQITNGLASVGEKLKQMGPIAGAAYAKQMGISYKEAIKAASADLQETGEEAMTPEDEAAEQMKKMMEATQDTMSKLGSYIEKIKGGIRELGPIMLAALSAILPTVLTLFKKNSKIIKEDAATNIQEGIEKGSKTAAETLKENLYNAEVEAAKEAAKEKNKGKYNPEEDRKKQHQDNIANANTLTEMAYRRISAEQQLLEKKVTAEQKLADIRIELNNKQKEEYDNAVKIADLEQKIATVQDDTAKASLQAALDKAKIDQDSLIEQRKGLEKMNADAEKEKLEATKRYVNMEGRLKEAQQKILGSKAYARGVGVGKIVSKTIDVGLKVIEAPKKLLNSLKNGVQHIFDKVNTSKLADKFKRFKIGFSNAMEAGRAGRAAKAEAKAAKKAAKAEKGGGGKSPWMLLLALLAPLVAILKDKIQPLLDELMNSFAPIMEQISDVVKGLLEKLMPVIQPLIDSLMGMLGPILGQIMEVLSPLFELLKPILDLVMSLVGLLFDLLGPALYIIAQITKKVLVPILSFIIKAINGVVNAIRRVLAFFGKKWKQDEDNITATKANTEAQEEANNKGPEKITNNGGVVTVSKTGSTANTPTASTNTTAKQSAVTGNTNNSSSKDNSNSYLALMVEKTMALNTKMKGLEEAIKKLPISIRSNVEESFGLTSQNKAVSVVVEGENKLLTKLGSTASGEKYE